MNQAQRQQLQQIAPELAAVDELNGNIIISNLGSGGGIPAIDVYMCTTNPNAGLKTDLDQGRKLSQCAQSSLLNQNQNSSNQINLSEGRENINMS